jgi:hypothetical protein
MLELLTEIFASCWKLLGVEVPDCVAILQDLQSGRRSMPPGSKGYLWLCNMTTTGAVIRFLAMSWFFLSIADLLLHLRIGWPPFEFHDTHHVWWGFSLTDPAPNVSQVHFCQSLAIVSMTTFVVGALTYYALARLSAELVAVLCPISPNAEQRSRTIRRRRRNEVA